MPRHLRTWRQRRNLLLHDFLEAGRAGYVDFGQVAPMTSKTGKQNTAPLQLRRKGFCNLTVALAQFLRHTSAAGNKLPRVSPFCGIRAKRMERLPRR